jgi:hypothetical protein
MSGRFGRGETYQLEEDGLADPRYELCNEDQRENREKQRHGGANEFGVADARRNLHVTRRVSVLF